MSYKKRLGSTGERIVLKHYLRNGYDLVDLNVHLRYGEIDIIVLKNDILVCIEVKTRTSYAFGAPEESITARKLERMRRCADVYVERNKLDAMCVEIHVCALVVSDAKMHLTIYRV